MMIGPLLGLATAFGADGACGSVAVERVIQDAQAALARGDRTAAPDVLAAGGASLACLDEPARADAIIDLYQIMGFTAWKTGDLELVRQWWGRAIAADPARGLDSGLGSAAEKDYEKLRQELLAHSRATLAATGPIWVDGREHERGRLDLVAGEHLLQQDEDGKILTELRSLRPGEHVRFPEGGDRGAGKMAVMTAAGLGAAGAGLGLYLDLRGWLYLGGCAGTSKPTNIDVCDDEVDVAIRGRQGASIALMAGGGALAAAGLWVGVGQATLTVEPTGFRLSGRW